MTEVKFIASRQLKCPECKREFQITANDLKKVNDRPGYYLWECPKCCNKGTISYGDLPVFIRDSL